MCNIRKGPKACRKITIKYNQAEINKCSWQPDIQDHLQQNIKEVDDHCAVQEALQILKCHTEPNPIQQSYTNDQCYFL